VEYRVAAAGTYGKAAAGSMQVRGRGGAHCSASARGAFAKNDCSWVPASTNFFEVVHPKNSLKCFDGPRGAPPGYYNSIQIHQKVFNLVHVLLIKLMVHGPRYRSEVILDDILTPFCMWQ
jgi:hypothetical protein